MPARQFVGEKVGKVFADLFAAFCTRNAGDENWSEETAGTTVDVGEGGEWNAGER